MTDGLPHGLVAPRYDLDSLASVLPAAAGALGVDLVTGTGVRSLEAARHHGFADTQRVCVVLVDGLGLENLRERSGHAPFVRGRLDEARALTSSFPSTTAAALGTFGTGTAPGLTGMLGYTQRDAATGTLANMVSWAGASDPETVQREATVFEGVAAHLPVTSVGPRRFEGSGMTRAALRGSRYRAAETLEQRVEAVLDVLRAPGLAYLYWGDIDKAGHHHGAGSWQWGDELEAFDRELAALARRLPRGTTLVMTADHGMVDVDRAERWDVAHDPQLSAGVDLVGGEPRATHLYTREPEAVAARWREVLGESAFVRTFDEAHTAGLLGPVASHVRPAVGDVLVAMRGRATVVDSASQTPASLELIGVHGSLTATEMTVPLLRVEI